MNDETRAKLEALAAVECKSNTVQNMHSNQCSECKGTEKRFWPLYPLHLCNDHEVWILYAVEQCLGLLGSWSLHHRGRWFIYDSGIPDSVSGREDRLTAAVECLWEAANG